MVKAGKTNDSYARDGVGAEDLIAEELGMRHRRGGSATQYTDIRAIVDHLRGSEGVS